MAVDAADLAASRYAAGSSVRDAINYISYISPRAAAVSAAMSWGSGPPGLAGALQLALSDPSSGLEGLEELLARGCADPNEALPDGTMALSEAARAGERSVCATLLRHQADPNVVDGTPRITPLHSAVFSGDASLVSLLLAHRANVHAQDCAGQTPLFFAPSRPICQMLADAQAEINVKNQMQQTALHLAAHAGMAEALEWFAAVADPLLLNAVDSSGSTAADYAAGSRSKTAARLLRVRGAHRSSPEQSSHSATQNGIDLYAQGIRSRPAGDYQDMPLTFKPQLKTQIFSQSRKASGGVDTSAREEPLLVDDWRTGFGGLHDHPAASSTAVSDQVIRRPMESPAGPPAPRRLNRDSRGSSANSDSGTGVMQAARAVVAAKIVLQDPLGLEFQDKTRFEVKPESKTIDALSQLLQDDVQQSKPNEATSSSDVLREMQEPDERDPETAHPAVHSKGRQHTRFSVQDAVEGPEPAFVCSDPEDISAPAVSSSKKCSTRRSTNFAGSDLAALQAIEAEAAAEAMVSFASKELVQEAETKTGDAVDAEEMPAERTSGKKLSLRRGTSFAGFDKAALAEADAEDEEQEEEDRPAEESRQVEEARPEEEKDRPVEQDQPKEEDRPVEEDRPKEEERPVKQDRPKEEVWAAEEDRPVEEVWAAEEDRPVEEDRPKGEERLESERANEGGRPVQEAQPTEEVQPIEEGVPAIDQSFEVVLQRTPEGDAGFGFDVTNHTEECDVKHSINIGVDVLLVSSIREVGQLESWNIEHPETQVMVGDRLLEINGVCSAQQMKEQLVEAQVVKLRLLRPPECMTLSIERNGSPLGMVVTELRNAMSCHLAISQVETEGAVADHNSRMASAGIWESVILPDMRIVAVNGVRDNTDDMMDALRSRDPVELDVLRTAMPAPEKPTLGGTLEEAANADAALEVVGPVSSAAAVSGDELTVEEIVEAESPTVEAESPIEKPPVMSTQWEVSLERIEGGTFGFQAMGFRELCNSTQQLRHCLDAGNEKGCPDVLLVTQILPDGPLAAWNEQQPEKEVRIFDCFEEINKTCTVMGMQHQLKEQAICSRLSRPPMQFNVVLDKRGGSLGFSFKKANRSGVHQLLITEVLSQGALAEHNIQRAAAGEWYFVVLPDMHIGMVNGIQGDQKAMAEAICTAQVVDLWIMRTSPMQAPNPVPGNATGAWEAPRDAQVPQDDRNLGEGVWEAVLHKDNISRGDLGLMLLDIKKKIGAMCQGPEALQVVQVDSAGLVSTKWNVEQPKRQIRVGDHIVGINGANTAEEMLQQLAEPVVRLRVFRPPAHFEALVDRRADNLGFSFKRSKKVDASQLLITEVMSNGALATYNLAQAIAGRWSLVVLPEMCITAVNGEESDFMKMVQFLRVPDVVKLCIQRRSQDESSNKVVKQTQAHAAVYEETSESSCWDIFLERATEYMAGAGRFGMDVLDHKECNAQHAININMEVLLVEGILPGGRLARWNADNPDKQVQAGDRILHVNGIVRAEEMQRELCEAPTVQVRLLRPPEIIIVVVERRKRSLGLGFRKPTQSSKCQLRVMQIHPEGAVAANNAWLLSIGKWESMVLPGMNIVGVNGVKDDLDNMVEVLRSSPVVELKVHRMAGLASQRDNETSSQATPGGGEQIDCRPTQISPDTAAMFSAELDNGSTTCTPVLPMLGTQAEPVTATVEDDLRLEEMSLAPSCGVPTPSCPEAELENANVSRPLQDKVQDASGGIAEAAAPVPATAEHDREQGAAEQLDFHFERLSFAAIDQEAFKKEFISCLGKLGASQELLASVNVQLRPGSVIARVSGSVATMQNLKGLPLEGKVSVMGVEARLQVVQKPPSPAPAAPPLPPVLAPTPLSWEVVLQGLDVPSKRRRSSKGTPSRRRTMKRTMMIESQLGFSLYNYSKDFHEKLGMSFEEDIYVIGNVRESGLLAAWNDEQPEARVQPGDRVLEVNGNALCFDILDLLVGPSVKMVLNRPPQHFKVILDKAGHNLGFKYKRRKGKMASLLITDIFPEGALARHNDRQRSIGNWQNVVLPGMRIWKVNDSVGDQAGMTEAIARSNVVELNMERAFEPREGTAPQADDFQERPASKESQVPSDASQKTPRAQTKLICAQCGETLQAGWKFCGECGTTIAEVKQDVSVSPAVTARSDVPWNLQRPDSQESNSPSRMQKKRPPTNFDVTLEKRGGVLGFDFKKSRGPNVHYLLITKVHTQGALPDHNATQVASGRWDLVVLPEMRVEAVNGIKGDLDFMMEALCACQVVELSIQRQLPGAMQLEPLKTPPSSSKFGTLGSPSPPGTPAMSPNQAAGQTGQVIGELSPGKTVPPVEPCTHLTSWDVDLARGRMGLGFEVVAHGANFWKEVSINNAPEVLVVTSVIASSATAGELTAIDTWNRQRPQAAVQVGDRIMSVNRTCTAEEMQRQLQASTVNLRFQRAPDRFDISLTKRGQSLGIGFRKPNDSSIRHLLIAEVCADGAVWSHNAVQAFAGRWDLLVLPEMQIVAVNGIEGNVMALYEELKNGDSVTLRIWRSPLREASWRPVTAQSAGSLSPEAARLLRHWLS